ncbi:MAG TPA: hypothetical protein VIJ68_04505, partial [Candidatus Saccharimonadales bacterium]
MHTERFPGPEIHYAPADDRGRRFGPRRLLGQRLLRDQIEEIDPLAGENNGATPDSDKVGALIDDSMYEFLGTDRSAEHNTRILESYRRFAPRRGVGEVDRMAILMHDFVHKRILEPKRTALQLDPELEPGSAETAIRAVDIKEEALTEFEKIQNAVGDQDGLMKAYLFAIDTAKWEEAARPWRPGATAKIDALVKEKKLTENEARILKAAVHKTDELDDMDIDELTRVLKDKGALLVDLKIGDIFETTVKYNVRGLFFKALETMDNIKNPPAGNPASTFRDCIEALSFFAPALGLHGYKELAAELRGAALEWLFDDPNGDVKRQHDSSQRHFSTVRNIAIETKEKMFSHIPLEDTEARLKTEGSGREKKAKPKYLEVHELPDTIGIAFVVPDTMSPKDMLRFAQNYMGALTWGPHRIVARHPVDTDPAFEHVQKKNDYNAINLSFYYYPDEGDPVPFEVQILTKTQSAMKTYGKWSDWHYKNDTEFVPPDQPLMDHMAKRGKAERELEPASTVQSIAEEVSKSPELPVFVFNKLFRAIDANGQRLLVPIALQEKATELADMLTDGLGEEGDLTVLPAAYLSKAQFADALSLLGVDINKDQNILNALELVKREARNKRSDGKTSVLEGHLLPVALAAVMLAVQSGEIWNSDKLRPDEYISNIVTIALLHDYVEAELDLLKDKGYNSGLILQKRE